MRIIILRSNSINPDPRVEKEVNTFLKTGYEVRILCWNRNGRENKKEKLILENGEIPIHSFSKKASYGKGIGNLYSLFFFQVFLLINLIKFHKTYDVIHACDFDTVIPSYITSKIFRKKYIYDIFDYYIEAFNVPSFLKPLIEKIDIFMINRAESIIITNESRKKQIRKSNPKKVAIIHNSPSSYNPPKNTVSINLDRKQFKFVYVGILVNSRFLVEITEVISQFPNVEFHIGGFGQLEDYFKKVCKEKDNIYFYGRLDYSSTLSLTEQCDVMIAMYNPSIPNHKYTSPNKLYEAMLLKKPIIVADQTGIDSLVKEHGIGYIVEYQKNSFYDLVEKLLETEQSVFQEIGRRSYRLYKDKYSWSIMENRLIDLYKQL